MKKKTLKGIIVFTLLLCLTFAFAGCGDKPPTPQVEEKANELEYKHIVTEEQKKAVQDFFKEVGDAFGVPFKKIENKDAFFETSYDISTPAPEGDTTFTYDETKKVYVKFEFQSVIKAEKVNESKALLKVKAGGTMALNNGDEYEVLAYFDTATENVALRLAKGGVTQFERNVIIGNVQKIKEDNPVKDFNFSLATIIKALDSALSSQPFIIGALGCNIETLYNQQVVRLLTRAMYVENNSVLEPAFNSANGKYSLNIDSNQVQSAAKSFFERAAFIQGDKQYNPKKDYNTDNKKDILDNDSDDFFKGNILEAAGVSGDWKDWDEHFKFSDNAFNFSMNFDKTSDGVENGNITVKVSKDASVTYPAKPKDSPVTITTKVMAKKGVELEVTNFKLSVKELGDNAVNTDDCKADIERIQALAPENLAKFKAEGVASAKYDAVEKNFDYSIDADVNVFALLNKTITADTVKGAINVLNFTVKEGETVVFSAVWDNSAKTLAVKYADGTTKDVTAEEIATMITKAKAKMNDLSETPLTKIFNDLIRELINNNGLEKIKLLKGIAINVSEGTVTIPSGIDSALLSILGLSYKDFVGVELDITKAIFPMVNGKSPTQIIVHAPKIMA